MSDEFDDDAVTIPSDEYTEDPVETAMTCDVRQSVSTPNSSHKYGSTPQDYIYADFPDSDSTRAPSWPQCPVKVTVSIKGTIMKGLFGVTMYEVHLERNGEVCSATVVVTL